MFYVIMINVNNNLVHIILHVYEYISKKTSPDWEFWFKRYLYFYFWQIFSNCYKNSIPFTLPLSMYEIMYFLHNFPRQSVFFFFFVTSLWEYNCFTMVCQFLLYNKVSQLYIYIYPHISSLLRLPPTLPIPTLQVVTKHRADLPVLCSCFPLAIY